MADEQTTNIEETERLQQEKVYPANSHKSRIRESSKATVVVKPEERKVEKVISGKATTQKKGLTKRLLEGFLGEDTRSVGEYIIQDVLILAAKRMICDTVGWGGAAEMILFGEKSGKNSRREGSRGGSYTSYGSYYKSTDNRGNDRRDISHTARTRHDFDEVIFETKGDAEEVLFSLSELVVDYGEATVRDFYDFAGITASFTDEKYGWTDLRGVRIRPMRSGYIIDLPRTRLLD